MAGSSGFVDPSGSGRQWYDLFSRGARDWLRHNDKVRAAVRDKLPELFAATTALAMIRDPAIVILMALQDLDLPALLLVEILDEAFPNSIPMHKKWDLVVAVKHFHQRRGIER